MTVDALKKSLCIRFFVIRQILTFLLQLEEINMQGENEIEAFTLSYAFFSRIYDRRKIEEVCVINT